ncbi:MAG: zinc ABC transporter substrate-binding protein [Firmicutes bacterium]|nr:zinc ABC transporter substrate-binding protein [Bacillota bacterium]
MKKMILIFILLISVGFSSACQDYQTESYDVYVTVYPMQYVAEEILKGTSKTVGIVPGVSSHQDSVDWSPKEIIAMTQASLLFYVGANYDQYIDFQIESIFSNKDVELVRIQDQTDYIEFIMGVVDDHHSEDETTNDDVLGYDPHFWISPKKVLQVSQLIYDKLSEKYSSMQVILDANYQNLVTKLESLDDDFSTVISGQVTYMMFSTNLYGYLRNDYGLNYLSISPGYHEETEQFTTQEKEDIVNEAVLHEIQYIVYESTATSPLSNAVFTELQNLGYEPIKLEYIVLQALTNDDKDAGKDYISVMYENLELIKLATGYIEG